MRNYHQLLFFLFSLQSLSIYSMDRSPYEKHRDYVDQKYLGLANDVYCRRLRGTFWSFYYSSGLGPSQALAKVQKIYEHVAKEDEFEELSKKHWYVYFVLQDAVNKEVQDLKAVTGSTIDELFYPQKMPSAKSFIHKRALKEFFTRSGIYKPLKEVPFGQPRQVHWTALYGHQANIEPRSLEISESGKYLRSRDASGQQIIWDMQEGTEVDSALVEDASWIGGWCPKGNKYCVTNRDYYAASDNSGLLMGIERPRPAGLAELSAPHSVPIEAKDDAPAVLLFNRPSEASWFSTQAYANSTDATELEELKASRCFDAVQGFPRKNLAALLKEKLERCEDE